MIKRLCVHREVGNEALEVALLLAVVCRYLEQLRKDQSELAQRLSQDRLSRHQIPFFHRSVEEGGNCH
jgi:hypothetical protein